MLPTVDQLPPATQSSTPPRVGAPAQLQDPVRAGHVLRIPLTAHARGPRPTSFRTQGVLPRRSRKAVAETGRVRDGP